MDNHLPPLARDNIQRFTGRNWVLPSLVSWIDSTEERYFVIVGEPGAGKSMLTAWLSGHGRSPTEATPRDQLEYLRDLVGAAHFFRADSGNSSPIAFAKAVSQQLSHNVEGFDRALAAAVPDTFSVRGTVNVQSVQSGGMAAGVYVDLSGMAEEAHFDRLFREPLRALYRDGQDRCLLLLIDGLDEALTYTGTSVVPLIARLADLPSQVRILVTTRPDPRILTFFNRAMRLDLVADEPVRGDDINQYVSGRLAHKAQSHAGAWRSDVASDIVSQAAGNFLYAALIADGLIDGGMSSGGVGGTPGGLNDLYHSFLLRELALNDQQWHERYMPIMGVLSVARAPGLTRQQISHLVQYEAGGEIRRCRQFLTGTLPDGPFRIFHQSFVDFLLADQNNYDYHIDAASFHATIADYYLSVFIEDWKLCDGYALMNLPTHLHMCGRNEALSDLLSTFGWLSRKLDVAGIAAVLSDYALVWNDNNLEPDIKLIRGALELSANALAVSKLQLAPQLIGRLHGDRHYPRIAALLSSATAPGQWLRPLNQSLTAPGSPLVRILRGHTNRINSIAITSDSRYAVAASSDCKVTVWDIPAGVLVRTMEGHAEGLNDVAVSPDGQYAFSASGNLTSLSTDNSLVVWDLNTGTARARLDSAEMRIVAVDVSLDGRYAASVADYEPVKIWDLADLRLHRELVDSTKRRDELGMVERLIVTSDGRVLVLYGYELEAWEIATGKRIFRARLSHAMGAMAVSSTGDRIMIASDSNSVLVMDLNTMSTIMELSGHVGRVTSICVTPDDQYVVAASEDGTIRIWDARDGRRVGLLVGHTASIETVTTTPDGRLIVSGGRDDAIRIWDLALAIGRKSAGSDSDSVRSVTDIAVSDDHGMVVAGFSDGTIQFSKLDSSEEVTSVHAHPAGPVWVSISDSAETAISCSVNGRAAIWSIPSGEMLKRLSLGRKNIQCMVSSSEGRWVLVADSNDVCTVWDLRKRRRKAQYRGHVITEKWVPDNWPEGVITGIGLIGEKKLAISMFMSWHRGLFWSGDAESTIAIWSMEGGRQISCQSLGEAQTSGLAVGGRGEVFFYGRNSNIACMDIEGTGLPDFWQGSDRVSVNCVGLSTSGRYMVSCGIDQSIKIFDQGTALVISEFLADDAITCCAVSNNGYVAAGDRTGRLIFFQLVSAPAF